MITPQSPAWCLYLSSSEVSQQDESDNSPGHPCLHQAQWMSWVIREVYKSLLTIYIYKEIFVFLVSVLHSQIRIFWMFWPIPAGNIIHEAKVNLLSWHNYSLKVWQEKQTPGSTLCWHQCPPALPLISRWIKLGKLSSPSPHPKSKGQAPCPAQP